MEQCQEVHDKEPEGGDGDLILGLSVQDLVTELASPSVSWINGETHIALEQGLQLALDSLGLSQEALLYCGLLKL